MPVLTADLIVLVLALVGGAFWYRPKQHGGGQATPKAGSVGLFTTPAGSVPLRVVCHKSQDRDVLLGVALHDFDEETPQRGVLQVT